MLASKLAFEEEKLRSTAEMTERHGATATQLQDALAAVCQLASAVIATLQVPRDPTSIMLLPLTRVTKNKQLRKELTYL